MAAVGTEAPPAANARRTASRSKGVDAAVVSERTEAPPTSRPPPPPQTSGPPLPAQRTRGVASAGCVVIWCDHLAFKDDSVALRARLDSATGLPTKAHKTAEKCIRLLRKKRNAKARPLSVFLVSFANAPPLARYLSTADHVDAKLVVLCDNARCRSASAKLAGIDGNAAGGGGGPLVEAVVGSFEEAVAAVVKLTRAVMAGMGHGGGIACEAEDETDLGEDDVDGN